MCVCEEVGLQWEVFPDLGTCIYIGSVDPHPHYKVYLISSTTIAS